MPQPQSAITLPRTRHAIFQVYGVRSGPAHLERVRRVAGTVDGLVRAVGARAPDADLSCVVAFGSDIWDRLVGPARPRELHPFRELRSGPRFAPSTPGDLFLHIRADDLGLCFELASQIAAQLGESVTPIDETHGFRYFDERDLTGFVDGTENPTGPDRDAAAIVGDDDPAFAGGSYIMVQKYLHDLQGWDRLSVVTQEGIIGRTKLDDIELDESVKPSFAHNALTLVEENGEEVDVLRHNMPFGKASGGEAGTYFIAYAKTPRPLEIMLENMVIGRPPGNYDRLLDFTHPVTGTLFFAPSMDVLAALAEGTIITETLAASVSPASGGSAAPARPSPRGDGSLKIGSLKGHE